MKIPFLPAVLRPLVLVAGLLAPLGASAASNNTESAVLAWERAVKEYVTAATQQLRDIRAEVDLDVKNRGGNTKERYANVYFGLDRSDSLLALLKVAPAARFDEAKLIFETARGEMTKELEAVRKAG